MFWNGENSQSGWNFNNCFAIFTVYFKQMFHKKSWIDIFRDQSPFYQLNRYSTGSKNFPSAQTSAPEILPIKDEKIFQALCLCLSIERIPYSKALTQAKTFFELTMIHRFHLL